MDCGASASALVDIHEAWGQLILESYRETTNGSMVPVLHGHVDRTGPSL